jgi:hypothetical protein
VVRARAVLFALQIVGLGFTAWACAEFDQAGVRGTSLDSLNWGLVNALVAFIYTTAHGISAAVLLKGSRSEGLLTFVARGIYADVVLAFSSFSAATALAVVAPLTPTGSAAVGAAMTFAAWAVLLWLVPLSWALSRERRLARTVPRAEPVPESAPISQTGPIVLVSHV